MSSPAVPITLQFLLFLFAGWVSRRQQAVIAYLLEENRVLREQLGGRRLLLSDGQRRRLAVKGTALGRKGLSELAGIVTPDTILRWTTGICTMRWSPIHSLSRVRSWVPRRVSHGRVMAVTPGWGVRTVGELGLF